MAAVYGAQSGTSTNRRNTSPSAIATPRPNSAVIRGRPMATTEPKVISKMIAATIRPSPSEPAATVCDLVATAPPTSTWREPSAVARMGATSALASSGVNSSAVMSRTTSAYAVVASAEIWWAPSCA